MAAGTHVFEVEQEATFRYVFTWAQVLPAGTTAQPGDRQVTLADGSIVYVRPYDLTGCTARMHVRPRVGGDLQVELTTENGGLTLGGTAGTITIYMTGTQTDQIIGKKPVYDILVKFPSGDTRRALQGTFAVSPNVTEMP